MPEAMTHQIQARCERQLLIWRWSADKRSGLQRQNLSHTLHLDLRAREDFTTSYTLRVLYRTAARLPMSSSTCGLRNSANPTPGNLNPQETTNQADREVVAGGPELSCPGSNVVAKEPNGVFRDEVGSLTRRGEPMHKEET